MTNNNILKNHIALALLCELRGFSLRSLRLKAFDRKVRKGLAKYAKKTTLDGPDS